VRRTPATQRDSNAGLLVFFFVLFVVGGLLLVPRLVRIATEDAVGPGMVAWLVGPRRVERLRQGYVVPTAAPAPYCEAGRTPRFEHGFAALQARLGGAMGEPLECEHGDSASGNVLQQTSTGLAVYDPRTNRPSFTDGWRTSELTPRGLVSWEGAARPTELLARP
jgi:hypothetical protein